MTRHLNRVVLFAGATLFLAASLVLTGTALAADPTVDPGEWTTTSKTEITGMPIEIPSNTSQFSHCVTKADAEKGVRAVTEDSARQQGCTSQITPHAGSSTTWDWTLSCNREGMIQNAQGQVTFVSPDHYKGQATSEMALPGGATQHIQMSYDAVRTGDCAK